MRIKKISQVAGVIASVMNNFKESETDTYSCNYINDLTKTKGEDLPIGSIVRFGGSTIPTGWLLCDGSAVSRATYSELFAAIGINYGAGDNSTTFNLPNSKGRVGVGVNLTDTDFNSLGKTGGDKSLQNHEHMERVYSKNYNQGVDIPSGRAYVRNFGTEGNGTWAWSNNTTVTEAELCRMANTEATGLGNSGNLQPYETYNYIIKAFQNAIVLTFAGPCASFCETDNYTLPSANQYYQIPLNHTDYNDANTFKLLGDGSIKVQKNISRVQVNYNIRAGVKTGTVFLKCFSTSDEEGFMNSESFTYSETTEVSMNASGILKVAKGDIINLSIYSTTEGTPVYGISKSWCGLNLAVLESSENFSDELIVQEKTLSDTNVYSANYVNTLEQKITELQNKLDNSVAYCKMQINGIETISREGKIITSFIDPVNYGGFIANKDNGYLFIPKGTKTIETCGMICGKGYLSARLEIKDADGTYLPTYNYTSGSILTQPSGNGYTATALPTSIIELDETKDWYIYIKVGGYTQDFLINDGFGQSSCWFGAKKIR